MRATSRLVAPCASTRWWRCVTNEGAKNEFITSGNTIGGALIVEASRFYFSGNLDAGARHWSEFEHLQRHQCRFAQGSSVPEAGPIGPASGRTSMICARAAEALMRWRSTTHGREQFPAGANPSGQICARSPAISFVFWVSRQFSADSFPPIRWLKARKWRWSATIFGNDF